METLRRVLFDRPLGIYVFLGLVCLVLLAAYRRKRTPARAAAIALPILSAVAVLVLERVVVTDRERIVRILHEIAADAEAGRTDALERCLDEDYAGFEHGGLGLDKSGAVLLARWAMRTYGIERVEFTRTDVQVRRDADPPEALVRLGTMIGFNKSALGSGRAALRWRLDWIRRPEGWRIVRVARPEPGLAPGPAED